MNIIVDGIVYGFQKYGGINTYFNEVMPRIAERYGATVHLLIPRTAEGSPPRPPVRVLPREFMPYRTGLSWRLDKFIEPRIEKINFRLMDLWVRSKKKCVFHSSYFTWVGDSVPQVGMVHDMNHELFPELYQDKWGLWLRQQYREYLSHATRIIAVSQKTKNDIIRFYGIDPPIIDVVYHATNKNRFWPEQGSNGRKLLQTNTGLRSPYILYVGGRWTYKNFNGLLRAFAQSSLNGKMTLAVVGPPWNQRELQQIWDFGLDSNVQLIVNPPDELLRALYSFATAFVYPSYNEGFGIPLLEAMACGTLILASDSEVFHEVAGDTAIYFNPYDPVDMSRVFEASLDENTRKEYIARGFKQVAKYSWDTCAEQTMFVYQKAMASKGC